jgi:cold shock protein
VPTGKVKWYDAEKGFGFLARDDGGEVFVHSSALPDGTTTLAKGQRVEFGIVEGRKGAQALQVHLLEAPPVVAAAPKHPRKKPDEMIPIIEDLMKLLDGISDDYRRGKHPDPKEAKQIADLLKAVANDLAGLSPPIPPVARPMVKGAIVLGAHVWVRRRGQSDGKVTVTSRPPSEPGRAVTLPRCAVTTDWTMDRPRPTPSGAVVSCRG